MNQKITSEGTVFISINRIKILVLLEFLTVVSCGAYPNINITSPEWQTTEGVVVENNTLHIQGDPLEIRSTYCAVPSILFENKNYVFICDIRMSHFSNKDLSPKVFVEVNSQEKFSINSIQVPDPNTWRTLAFLCRLETVKQVEDLKIKVVLEKCSGTLELRNPHFSSTPPEFPEGLDENKIFPFTLPSVSENILHIRLDEKKEFQPEVLGVNKVFMITSRSDISTDGNLSNIITASDSRVIELVQRVSPLSIRFPAGTMGNWYNWETDTFAVPDWQDLGPRFKKTYSFVKQTYKWDFEGYAYLCKKYEIAPVLMVNILYDSPEKCAAGLRHRIEHNVRPTWVELGNENYMDMQRGVGNVATVEDYIQVTRQIVKALKQVDPNVKCAVNIPGLSDRTIPVDPWTKTMMKEDYYEGVIIHPYLHVPVIYHDDKEAMKKLLGAYGFMREYLNNCVRDFRDKKILISEWGVSMHGVTGLNSFLQEIADAEQIMAIIDKWDEGVVAQSSIHQFLGGRMGLYDFDPGKGCQRFMKRRKGILYEILWQTFRGGQLFSARPKTKLLPDKDSVYNGIPVLNARAVESEDGKIKIFCVNKLPRTEHLKIVIDSESNQDSYEQLIFKEKLSVNRLYELEESPYTVLNGRGTVSVPPYSINLITLINNL